MAKVFRISDCNQCKKRIDAFKVLREEDFRRMDERRFEVLFNEGEIILKQGSPFTHTICILEGLVKVYLESRDKKNFILSLQGPGEMIGCPGMYTDGKHHFTVAAVEDTMTCMVEREVMEEIIKTNNLFAIELLKRSNLRNIRYYKKFKTLTQKQMPGRVAEVLIYLSSEIYKSNPIRLTLSRQDMADMAAITKESTIRILKEFKDAGIISLTGDDLRILNEKTLQTISENG